MQPFTNLLMLGAGRSALVIDYLICAGGGAGGGGGGGVSGGHGGGGGVLTGTGFELAPGSYAVTVGAGGAIVESGLRTGANGGNSAIAGIGTAIGGGGGGGGGAAGSDGGSGGGAGSGDQGAKSGGSGTSGQGWAGGAHGGDYVTNPHGAGGGGATGVGQNTNSSGAAGGPGLTSSISGSSVEYGKGGSFGETTPNLPGQGGHGSFTITAIAGAAGRVVIRYPGPQRATGGTVTSVGGYTIHTFTSNSTFTVF